MRFRRVVVAVTGETVDDEAVGLGCLLARESQGKVHVLHVMEVKRTLPLDAAEPAQLERGEAILARARQTAERAAYPVDTELLPGREVGPVLVYEAAERAADVLIVGLDYKRQLGEPGAGEVAAYVLRHAPCRVWLCRGQMAGVERG